MKWNIITDSSCDMFGFALMVSMVALGLRSYIDRIIATALWRKRTQSLRSQEFTGTDIKYLLLLVLRQW